MANQNELDYIISQWEPKGKTSKLIKGRENAATSLHLISIGVYNADFLDRTEAAMQNQCDPGLLSTLIENLTF